MDAPGSRDAGGGMNLHPATSPSTSAGPAGPLPRRALMVAAALAAAAFAAVATGLVQPPDLEGALTDLSETLGAWTYALVGGLAFLETGAFVGLVAPGETAIVLGGVVAAGGDVDIGAMLLIAWLAAALGDLVSFGLGKRLGRRFLLARGPRLGVTAARLERVEGFFERHGAKAILVGRFIGLVRAVAPFLAGASGMRLRAFLPWSLLGTAAWATTFTLVGFAFHESFSAAAGYLTHGALGLAVLAAAAFAWREHRRARERARLHSCVAAVSA
jgi:membrane-associated protein